MPSILPMLCAAVAVASVVTSCAMSPDKYMADFDRHRSKFSTAIERNGMKATITYLPSEYVAARDMLSKPGLHADSAMKPYANSLFMALGIASKEPSNGSALLLRNGAAGWRENVLSNTFGLDEGIFLLNGRDTVKASGYNYERNWGLTGEDVFVLTFSRSSLKSNVGNYHLVMRGVCPELGTLDAKLSTIVKNTRKLRG